MKSKILLALVFYAFVLISACKKDEAIAIPVNASSVDNWYTETGLPVQTAITQRIDSNIGGYLEALPAHYHDHYSQKFPLIIFLHGQGQTGDGSQSSLTKVASSSVPHLIATQTFPINFSVNNIKYQFIVLSPQFKSWPQPSDINDMLNFAIKRYRLNYEKLYVCGLSMGGGGTWDYAWNYGKRITAIVPMAGASWPTTYKAQCIAQDSVAVWAFHNSNDSTVPAWYSTDYVQYINQYKPVTPAKLTLWPTGGHDCWDKASDPNYRENGMDIYEWMLSQNKKKN